MTPEELDEARAKEARRLCENPPYIGDAAYHAARLAREGWTPPEPVVDPDLRAFRDWASTQSGVWKESQKALDHMAVGGPARAYLAGARMARERERERARPLVEYVEALGYSDYRAQLLAKYMGEA